MNVIRVSQKGNQTFLRGFNSDVIGFTKSIEPLLERYHRKALILGTGGAAKAVDYGLKSLGLETQMVSRSRKTGAITYDDVKAETIEECSGELHSARTVSKCGPLPHPTLQCHELAHAALRPTLQSRRNAFHAERS